MDTKNSHPRLSSLSFTFFKLNFSGSTIIYNTLPSIASRYPSVCVLSSRHQVHNIRIECLTTLDWTPSPQAFLSQVIEAYPPFPMDFVCLSFP